MATGLSIATNLLSNSVQLNLDNNQKQLQNVVTQLSSGLRINTAADDPSGNAIATNLTSQYEAFNQASQNVQNANNAAQVALGALTQQTDILQRIRVLAVEAASDVNSSSDRANLQAEVSQLLLEVNRIAQNTNFNGQALLDGSHQGNQAGAEAYYTITANAALLASGVQSIGTSTGFLIASVGITAGAFFTSTATGDETIEVQVIANTTNPTAATPQLEVTTFNSSTSASASFLISLGATGQTFVASIDGGTVNTRRYAPLQHPDDRRHRPNCIRQDLAVRPAVELCDCSGVQLPVGRRRRRRDPARHRSDEHQHAAHLERQPRGQLIVESVARGGRRDRPDRHRAANAQHAASADSAQSWFALASTSRTTIPPRSTCKPRNRTSPTSTWVKRRRIHEAAAACPSRYLRLGAVERERAVGSHAVPLIDPAGNRAIVSSRARSGGSSLLFCR